MEITRRRLSWLQVKSQARESLGDEAELRDLGESLRQRQLSRVSSSTHSGARPPTLNGHDRP